MMDMGETDLAVRVRFQREAITPAFLDEILPLASAHAEETLHWKDMPLKLDRQRYLDIEARGDARLYTIRDGDKLVGYAVYFLAFHPHHSDALTSLMDVIYIAPSHRGMSFGSRFIKWCDTHLKAEGVRMSFLTMKAAHSFGSLAERCGYELIDLVYGKRLDVEKVV